MTRRVAVAAITILCVAAAELPDHVLNLSRVKRKALQGLKSLPDYTCLAVTERSQQNVKDRAPRRIDTIRMEVAHSGSQDLYAWPGANRFETTHAGEMIGSGMFGSGEFATHLKTVLDGYGVLTYVGAENTLGRKLLRWNYSIAPFATDWRISFASRTAVAGAKGSLWADAESLDVVRLEVRTDGLPPGFPITEVATTIDYARVRFGGREVLLAQTAFTELTEFSGLRNQNFTEFSHCRQYVTQSDISFGTEPAAGGMPASPSSGISEFVIPAGVRVFIALSTALDSQRASVGDAVEAVVTADASQKRRTVIPKGAVVHGRVRRMDAHAGPPEHSVVALEFTDVEYPGHHARFFGKLIQVSSSAPGLRTADPGAASSGHPLVPGVGAFWMEGTSFQLAKGMAMTWVTLDISKK